MSKFLSIFYDSFLEIKAGKAIYLYGIVTFFTILIFSLIPSIEIQGRDLFGADQIASGFIGELIFNLYKGFFEFIIFLMVFGSAWLIPAYLNKGRIELALSKPINRINLISLKFASVFLIMIVLLTVMMSLIWLTISIRLDHFNGGFFLGLIFGWFDFLIIFMVIYSIGILSRSGAVSLIAYFIIKIVSGLLASREIIYGFLGESAWKVILDIIYYILPKFGQITDNYISLMKGDGLTNGFAIWTTLAFSAVLYSVTVLIFRKRDY
jgi:ABC-type transport system involved in multi-copper enzyme maturation permease subunit